MPLHRDYFRLNEQYNHDVPLMGEKEDNETPKGPEWLWNPWWWIAIAAFAVTAYAVRNLF